MIVFYKIYILIILSKVIKFLKVIIMNWQKEWEKNNERFLATLNL
jgi:hypothetical protein